MAIAGTCIHIGVCTFVYIYISIYIDNTPLSLFSLSIQMGSILGCKGILG